MRFSTLALSLAVLGALSTPARLDKKMHTYDPKTQKFLDTLTAAGGPPLYTLSHADARKILRGAAGHAPAPPAKVEDVVWPVGPTGSVEVRIVRPEGSTVKLPAVLYTHGGGWVLGDKNTHLRFVKDIAVGANVAVVRVTCVWVDPLAQSRHQGDRFHRLQGREGEDDALERDDHSEPVPEFPKGGEALLPENKGLPVVALSTSHVAQGIERVRLDPTIADVSADRETLPIPLRRILQTLLRHVGGAKVVERVRRSAWILGLPLQGHRLLEVTACRPNVPFGEREIAQARQHRSDSRDVAEGTADLEALLEQEKRGVPIAFGRSDLSL